MSRMLGFAGWASANGVAVSMTASSTMRITIARMHGASRLLATRHLLGWDCYEGRRPLGRRPLSGSALLLGRVGLYLLLELGLELLQVEARALLHRRVLDEGLRGLRDLLLHEGEPPEFIRVPVVERERAGETGTLERI